MDREHVYERRRFSSLKKSLLFTGLAVIVANCDACYTHERFAVLTLHYSQC